MQAILASTLISLYNDYDIKVIEMITLLDPLALPNHSFPLGHECFRLKHSIDVIEFEDFLLRLFVK